MVLVIPFAMACITRLITKNSENFKNILSEQGDNLQPLASQALVIGPLIELPVLSVFSGILKRLDQE